MGEMALCKIKGIEFESWATGIPNAPKVLRNVAVLAPGERKMIAILLYAIPWPRCSEWK